MGKNELKLNNGSSLIFSPMKLLTVSNDREVKVVISQEVLTKKPASNTTLKR